MANCTYCDRPLVCESCGEEYVPPSPAYYEALSRPEVPLSCHTCGAPLVCHWCKTPYDGAGDDDSGGESL